MKSETTVYPLRIKKRLQHDEITEVKRLIEKTSMSGNSPRPLCAFINDFRTSNETMIYVVGCLGNYHDFILNTILKEKGLKANFISDEEAQEILDDIDENFLDYL